MIHDDDLNELLKVVKANGCEVVKVVRHTDGDTEIRINRVDERRFKAVSEAVNGGGVFVSQSSNIRLGIGRGGLRLM